MRRKKEKTNKTNLGINAITLSDETFTEKNKVKIKKLKVNPEYEKLVPHLSKEDYDNLLKSIVKDGVQLPIIINRKHVILDGHTRYKICQKYNIPFETLIKNFEDPLEEKKFVIEANLHRRSLNKSQKAMLAVQLLEIEEELAKQRKQEGYKYRKDMQQERVEGEETTPKESVETFLTTEGVETDQKQTEPSVEEKPSFEEKGSSTSIVAKKLNIGEGTVKRLKEIRDKIDKYPEIKEKFEKLQNNEDTITVGRLYAELKEKEKEELLKEAKLTNYIIEGNVMEVLDKLGPNSYDTVIMDPPYKNMAFDYKIFLFLIFPAMFKTISDNGKIFMFIDMENLDQVKTIFAVLDQFKKVYTHNLLIYPYRFPQTEEKAEPSYEHRYRGILLLSTKEKIQLTQYYHKKELVDLLTSPDQTEKIPFNVLKYIVNSATTEKELILNPFAGDGYVAQVLSSLNRKCIAIEKDPVKVKKAIKKRNLSKVETEKLSDVMSTLVKVK